VLEDDKESVLFRFSKRPDASFHSDRGSCEEKYGVEAEYHRITKQEDPFWLQYYQRSLLDCRLKSGSRILFLGINDGDELEPFRHWFPEVEAEFEYVGLDLAESALAKAKERFPERNVVMHQWDISNVKPDIGMFDCMVCIATLQSSNFEGKRVFRSWFQSCLKPDGSVILGLPNGRYHDGKLILGAAVKHYRLPEMGLLIKDLDYFKRYLQSKKKRVTVQGRGTVFLTATSLAKP
jgi:ubiquinone/menaquinone biosynthesis C-methylase UbiE